METKRITLAGLKKVLSKSEMQDIKGGSWCFWCSHSGEHPCTSTDYGTCNDQMINECIYGGSIVYLCGT